jgi:signal transduction histidine kinase
VREALEELVELQRYKAHAKNITLSLQLDSMDGCYLIESDQKRISQVIINFTNNAVKFTDENGHIEVYC